MDKHSASRNGEDLIFNIVFGVHYFFSPEQFKRSKLNKSVTKT